MKGIRSATVAKFLGESVLVLLVLALTACGGGETKSGGVSVGRETAGESTPAGPDLAQTEKGAAAATGEVDITEDPATRGDFGRKVVKTANLGLRTEEVRQNAAQAQQVAAAAGGSVLSSQVYRSGDSLTAQLVLSVPSAEFERVLDELRGLGEKVTTDSISG